MLEKREVSTCIILTIVTCGIYGIYWWYCILKDLYALNGQPDQAGTDILLSIITCGIYGIYLYYKMGKLNDSARIRLGLPSKDNSTLFLVLILASALFGAAGIVVFVIFAMVQGDINDSLLPAYYSNQYSYVVRESTEPPNNDSF